METTRASQQDWRDRLHEDDLVAHGRQIGKGLPRIASEDQVDRARERVETWARTYATVALLQSTSANKHRIDGELEKVNDLREQIPDWQQRVLDAEEALEDLRSDGIREPPKRPPMALFLIVGLLLGTVFGLIGATTIASVLRSIWRPDVADPESFYMAWGTAIGLFFGWVVGSITVLTREFAIGGGRIMRWIPVLMGLSIALGLAGYRFLQPSEADPSRIVIHISGLAVVLLFLEIGVLLAIEYLNHVAMNAWDRYHDRLDEYAKWSAREKAALSKLKERTRVFEEAKLRLTRAYEELAQLHDADLFSTESQQRKAEIEQFAVQAAIRGFELGWTERKAGA